MNLKEVLGDAYKEGMAFEEVEAALEKVTVPEDHSAEIERLKMPSPRATAKPLGIRNSSGRK